MHSRANLDATASAVALSISRSKLRHLVFAIFPVGTTHLGGRILLVLSSSRGLMGSLVDTYLSTPVLESLTAWSVQLSTGYFQSKRCSLLIGILTTLSDLINCAKVCVEAQNVGG